MQRAYLARMRWTRWSLPTLLAFIALSSWTGLADGSRSGPWAWLAAIGLTLFCLLQTRRWWRMRRLERQVRAVDD